MVWIVASLEKLCPPKVRFHSLHPSSGASFLFPFLLAILCGQLSPRLSLHAGLACLGLGGRMHLSPESALDLCLTVSQRSYLLLSGINLGLSYFLPRFCMPTPVGLQAPASCFSPFPMICLITTHFLHSAHLLLPYLLPPQVFIVKGLRGKFSPSPGTFQFSLHPTEKTHSFGTLNLNPVSTFLFSLPPTGQY